MFTSITAVSYQCSQGHEHMWTSTQEKTTLSFTATTLGQSIVRVRCLRTASIDIARYSLVDGATGTLPYHSWIVATGDEHWEHNNSDEKNTQTYLEAYLHDFSLSKLIVRNVL